LERVALERQSIEKKDFPIGRRGYDPEAVDAHLSSLADEIEDLKVSTRRRTETVASAASDQVRAIVDAAEKSAADIQRQAEEDAQETRAEASSEAQATRERASAQAREYVGKVSESTSVMLQRLDAMESELGALIDTLRTGANRLTADLQLLETNVADVHQAAGPRPRFELEAGTGSAVAADVHPVRDGDVTDQADGDSAAAAETYAGPLPEAAPAARRPRAARPARGQTAAEQALAEPPADPDLLDEAEPFAAELEATEADAAGAGPALGSDDTEGARLIALNMALNGTPRDETDRYLAENFTLSDRGRLLDEVYASVEG
jgi:DivIVA domain-containing protein